MKHHDIVAAGHICLDLSPAFEPRRAQDAGTLFRPGRLINMDGVTVSTGGAVSNTGFALSRLGLRVLPAARIGDDPFGRLIADIAERETGCRIPCRQGVRSSYSIVLSPPGIDRIILHDPADNNTFGADDIDFDAVRDARAFHFGYPPLMRRVYEDDGAELTRIFAAAKAQGALTSLDMALPDAASESGRVNWQKALQNVLPYVDLFMPSVEEALYMLNRAAYERVTHGGALTFGILRELAGRMLDMGAKLAFIKCGAHGIYIKTSPRMPDGFGARELFHPSYRAQRFVSALGCGDTAIAGFLAAFISGLGLLDCARAACTAGALCCATYDAIGAMRPLAQLRALTGGALNATDLPGPPLHYDEKERVYTL